MEKYKCEVGLRDGQNVIWVDLPNAHEVWSSFRNEFPDSEWDLNLKRWYILDHPKHRKKLGLQSIAGNRLEKSIHPTNRPSFIQFRKYLDKNRYSINSQNMYLSELAHLFIMLKDTDAKELSVQQLAAYLLYCSATLKMKERKCNGKLNALRLFFEEVLERPHWLKSIPRPQQRRGKKNTLSRDEVDKVFHAMSNPKYRLAFLVCYDLNVRLNDLVQMRSNEFDIRNRNVFIKRNQDSKRIALDLNDRIIDEAKRYFELKRPKVWLFEAKPGKANSVNSFHQVFKKAMNDAGIHKSIGVHEVKLEYADVLRNAGATIEYFQWK